MNRFAITLGAFGFATGLAFAQTSQPQNTTPPTDTPPASTPPTTDRSMGSSGQSSSSTSSPTDFDSLDRQHQGYVKRSDVSGDTWLTRNFATCDKNSDGQVSRTEYSACSTQR
jgi:hypothetical protein